MIPQSSSTPGTILIPLDGSEHAAHALSFALAIGGRESRLLLLQVIPSSGPIRGLLGNVLLSADQVQRAYDASARLTLVQARTEYLAERDDVCIEVVRGDPAEEIVHAVDRHDVGLIVLATHGLHGLDRWVIGSVADRVARTSPVPVLFIRPLAPVQDEPTQIAFERIVVPLDGSTLAAEALPFAERLAGQHGIPIRLVTVTDLPRELTGVLAYGAAFSAQAYDELLDQGRIESQAMLDGAAAPLRDAGLTVETQVLEGSVPEAIAAVTGPNDLIVMTSHGRGGVARWLLGSIATKLIYRGGAPVLLVPSSIRRGQSQA